MVYLSLGSNVGDKCQNLKTARHRLEETAEIRVVKASSFYLTEPWGKTDQDWFVNQVLAVETGLEPLSLLDTVLLIEERMGRVRQERWGPRTIDIDILLIDDRVINTDRLTVPHPRLHERGFVIIPLLEIAPGLVLPGRLPLQKVWENLVKNQETGCIKKLTCDKMSQRNIENG